MRKPKKIPDAVLKRRARLPAPPDDDSWCDKWDAQAITGLGWTTLCQAMDAGLIRYAKIGKARRPHKGSLKAFMRSREISKPRRRAVEREPADTRPE